MKHLPCGVAALWAGIVLSGTPAHGQTGFGASVSPRPWSRVAFFTNSSQSQGNDGTTRRFNELTTSFAYELPDVDEPGPEYGIDVRYSTYPQTGHPTRASVYQGFIGARTSHAVFRLGHLWMSDLGSLGSLAGGLMEFRQERLIAESGRFRAGLFGGLEPNVLDVGYASGVRKVGGYLAYDGRAARRHSLGYVAVKNATLTERSAITTTNFLPLGDKVFVYQAAEFDVQPPAGRAHRGLAYFIATGRVLPAARLELQGNYNRGRSVDTRSLSDDVLNGRPVTPMTLEGLLYESIGGRITVEVVKRVRAYAGYAQDKNNRDTRPTGRTMLGAYASNVGGSGIDVTASDSQLNRSTGSYHSRYVSIGRQLGRNVYLSGDYSTSLSVVRYSRSDGLIVETRPHTVRLSGTTTINLPHSISLLGTIERTQDDDIREFRLLSGITYRIQ